MLKHAAVSAVSGALVLAATPAMVSAEPNTVDPNQEPTVNVQVEKIAVLNVDDGGQTCSMVVDDTNDDFMGQDEGQSSSFDGDDLCTLTLKTNFTVEAIRFDFPRINGGADDNAIRGGFGTDVYFGKAVGQEDGNVLGVWPQAGYLDGNGDINGGGGGIYTHDGSNTPLLVTGPHRQNDNSGFDAGTHRFGVGVATNWRRTLIGQQEFAPEDTYTIDINATIVPTVGSNTGA